MVAGHEGTATFGPLCHLPRTILLFLFQPWRGHCGWNLQAFDRMAPGRPPALGFMLRWFPGALPALSGSPCLGLSCPAASPLHHLPHPCFWWPHSVHHCSFFPSPSPQHLFLLALLSPACSLGSPLACSPDTLLGNSRWCCDKQSAFPCRRHGVQSLCWENPLE